jgi:hypothetical protein
MVQPSIRTLLEVRPFESTSKFALALPPGDAPSINQRLCEYDPMWFAAMLWPKNAGLRAASSVRLIPDCAVVQGMMWYDSPISRPPTGGL